MAKNVKPHGAKTITHTSVKIPLPEQSAEGSKQGARFWAEAMVLFVVLFVLYVSSPVINSGDSHFVIPTALSMIRHGDANVDEYAARFNDAAWAVREVNGHHWNMYPAGVPMMVLPLVFVADQAARVAGIDLEKVVQTSPNPFVELVLSSIVAALAAMLIYLQLRRRLSIPKAMVLAGLFGLGTSMYSSASRGLWSHAPSVLLITAAIIVYDKWGASKWHYPLFAGILLGFSYGVRPSNIAVIGIFGLLFALMPQRVSALSVFAAGVGLGVIPIFCFHLAVFGKLFSPYYELLQRSAFTISMPWWPAIGTLFSPSRGLFIFSPFLLFVFARFLPSMFRRYPLSRLEIALIGLVLISWVAVFRWPMWWGGGSFGPRVLCDILPFLILLMAPVMKDLSFTTRRQCTAVVAFSLLAAVSVGIHLRGATMNEVVNGWNGSPVSVDVAPDRVWDWGDIQFLRGIQK